MSLRLASYDNLDDRPQNENADIKVTLTKAIPASSPAAYSNGV